MSEWEAKSALNGTVASGMGLCGSVIRAPGLVQVWGPWVQCIPEAILFPLFFISLPLLEFLCKLYGNFVQQLRSSSRIQLYLLRFMVCLLVYYLQGNTALHYLLSYGQLVGAALLLNTQQCRVNARNAVSVAFLN